MCGIRCDEGRMIEPAVDKCDVDVFPLFADVNPGGSDVLAILLAARVRVLGGRDEPDGVAKSGRVHLAQCVGEQRMPVAHPDKDRERIAGSL
jgi:hypothetical protein